ncbi:cobalt transporter [Rhodobacterales bacterium 52_120_T64]|nr:cobalt transporter [Rhodobacterales bacterium 52_120_T64]
MLKNLVYSALFAGLAAGIIVAALTILMLVPLLLEAELYETGQLIHFGDVTAAMPDIHAEHDWARNGLTALFAATIYIGFAFVMVAVMAFAQEKGVQITTRSGILWGLAGYASFQLAPAMGMPPELPGMIAAEITQRQIWMIGTILATTVGIASIVFGKNWAHWGVGLVILAIPHVIGAPHPEAFGGTVPPELAAEFAGRSLAVGAVGWIALGVLSAYFWLRENR